MRHYSLQNYRGSAMLGLIRQKLSVFVESSISTSLARTPLLIDEASIGRRSLSSPASLAMRGGTNRRQKRPKDPNRLQFGGGYGVDPYYSFVRASRGKGRETKTLSGLAQKAHSALIDLYSRRPPPPHFYGND